MNTHDDTWTSCFNIVNSVVQILYNKKFPWLHHQHAQYQYESRSCNWIWLYVFISYKLLFITVFTVPILCVDEAYFLLQRLTYQGKSTTQMSLSIERLCRCYDGDFWYVLKGTKGKRVGVTSDSPPCFYHSSAVPRFGQKLWLQKMGWQRQCFSFIEEDQKILQKTLTLLTSLLLNPIHSRRWGYWCYVFFY